MIVTVLTVLATIGGLHTRLTLRLGPEPIQSMVRLAVSPIDRFDEGCTATQAWRPRLQTPPLCLMPVVTPVDEQLHRNTQSLSATPRDVEECIQRSTPTPASSRWREVAALGITDGLRPEPAGLSRKLHRRVRRRGGVRRTRCPKADDNEDETNVGWGAVLGAVVGVLVAVHPIATWAYLTVGTGVYMLLTDLHFNCFVCAAISVNYWCAVAWVSCAVSTHIAVMLGLLAISMRGSVLLFPDFDEIMVPSDTFRVLTATTLAQCKNMCEVYAKGLENILTQFTWNEIGKSGAVDIAVWGVSVQGAVTPHHELAGLQGPVTRYHGVIFADGVRQCCVAVTGEQGHHVVEYLSSQGGGLRGIDFSFPLHFAGYAVSRTIENVGKAKVTSIAGGATSSRDITRTGEMIAELQDPLSMSEAVVSSFKSTMLDNCDNVSVDKAADMVVLKSAIAVLDGVQKEMPVTIGRGFVRLGASRFTYAVAANVAAALMSIKKLPARLEHTGEFPFMYYVKVMSSTVWDTLTEALKDHIKILRGHTNVKPNAAVAFNCVHASDSHNHFDGVWIKVGEDDEFTFHGHFLPVNQELFTDLRLPRVNSKVRLTFSDPTVPSVKKYDVADACECYATFKDTVYVRVARQWYEGLPHLVPRARHHMEDLTERWKQQLWYTHCTTLAKKVKINHDKKEEVFNADLVNELNKNKTDAFLGDKELFENVELFDVAFFSNDILYLLHVKKNANADAMRAVCCQASVGTMCLARFCKEGGGDGVKWLRDKVSRCKQIVVAIAVSNQRKKHTEPLFGKDGVLFRDLKQHSLHVSLLVFYQCWSTFFTRMRLVNSKEITFCAVQLDRS
jgi:hypothetical protein